MVEALREGRPGLRRTTVALAVTQLISWGVLYYAFAVVAPDLASQPGWGLAAVSGAFSAGLLAAGLSAHAVSAMLSRFGPRAVMTNSALRGPFPSRAASRSGARSSSAPELGNVGANGEAPAS